MLDGVTMKSENMDHSFCHYCDLRIYIKSAPDSVTMHHHIACWSRSAYTSIGCLLTTSDTRLAQSRKRFNYAPIDCLGVNYVIYPDIEETRLSPHPINEKCGINY